MTDSMQTEKEMKASATENEMKVPQPRLRRGGMIALITMCNAIAPLSTDMYMPALPDMASYFKAADSTMNLTLVVFFLFFALGILVFGPISDKIGRRPTMIAGISLYIAASIACGLAMNVYFLIAVRILQALQRIQVRGNLVVIPVDVFPGDVLQQILQVQLRGVKPRPEGQHAIEIPVVQQHQRAAQAVLLLLHRAQLLVDIRVVIPLPAGEGRLPPVVREAEDVSQIPAQVVRDLPHAGWIEVRGRVKAVRVVVNHPIHIDEIQIIRSGFRRDGGYRVPAPL